MPHRLSRRDFLLGAAALAALPARAEVPPGSARYLLELLVFRQPGAAPKAMPAPPLASVSTIAGRVETLAEAHWQLTAIEQSLVHHGGYRLLAHSAWAAIVPPNGRTTARLDEVLPADTPLAGLVAVQRSQYLFLGVDVDYVAPDGARYALRDRRRVKFGERHYFDHPAFGVIVQVTPSRGALATDA